MSSFHSLNFFTYWESYVYSSSLWIYSPSAWSEGKYTLFHIYVNVCKNLKAASVFMCNALCHTITEDRSCKDFWTSVGFLGEQAEESVAAQMVESPREVCGNQISAEFWGGYLWPPWTKDPAQFEADEDFNLWAIWLLSVRSIGPNSWLPTRWNTYFTTFGEKGWL